MQAPRSRQPFLTELSLEIWENEKAKTHDSTSQNKVQSNLYLKLDIQIATWLQIRLTSFTVHIF